MDTSTTRSELIHGLLICCGIGIGLWIDRDNDRYIHIIFSVWVGGNECTYELVCYDGNKVITY